MEDFNQSVEKTGGTFVLALRKLSKEEESFLSSMQGKGIIHLQAKPNYLSNQEGYSKVNRINIDHIYEQTYEDAFDQIQQFGVLPLKNGKAVAAHFQDGDGDSLWYYFRFMALYKHRSNLYNHRLAIQLKKLGEQYDKVIVYHASAFLKKRIKPLGIVDFQQTKSKQNRLVNNVVVFLINWFIRAFFGIFQMRKFFRKYDHLLISNAVPNQKIIRRKDLAEIEGDHFAEYLQEEIQGEKGFMNISEYFPPNLKDERPLGIRKSILFPRFSNVLHLEIVLFLQLINPWFYVRSLRGLAKVNTIFSNLELKEGSSDEYRLILPVLSSFKRLSYFLSVRKSALKWLFRWKNFSWVGGTNEHDPRVKSILASARASGVKTFGIQHGVIHLRHMHYCFTQEDAAYNPFPDFTFLWGEHWKTTLLNQSAYREETLVVVGQIRSDVIHHLLSIDKSKLIGSIDADKQTILYPSQPLYTGEEEMRKQLARDYLLLSKNFPEIQFLIKPHPKELDCEAFMAEIAQEVGTSNYQVVRGDLYKIIAASDLVVVYNSTVGAESVYFNKPLLVMDYSNNDFSGFIASGIGLKVSNYAQLEEKIKGFKAGQLAVNELAVQAFVSDRAYQIDGKVSQRIIRKLKA